MTGQVEVPERFSFNQITARGWSLPELADGCARMGVRRVALWREPVAEHGLARTAALMAGAGLSVSSLCRGGFFCAPGWFDDNRRAIDEAAALGAPVLVLVSGGLPAGSRDLVGARARVAEAVDLLAPHASAAGVTLAVEPLHPMFCADRCVISTLDQALAVARGHQPSVVGVVVDTYHQWWDDTVYDQIDRAGDRVALFQLADWVTPLPAGALTGRGMPGSGCIDLRAFRDAVDRTGYTGAIEVEVLSDEISARPGTRVLAESIEGYRLALG